MSKENKLIAEFMGFTIDGEFAVIEDEGSPLEESMLLSDMKYHVSWDWLMPVVEKIGNELTSISIDLLVMKDDGFTTMVKIDKLNLCITNENPIKATHEAVVEFIKWYNENN